MTLSASHAVFDARADATWAVCENKTWSATHKSVCDATHVVVMQCQIAARVWEGDEASSDAVDDA